jgi:hypothetical protein
MSKIAGLGEIREGILERDPLDDSLHLRCLDSEGRQAVVRIQDLLGEYVGHPVRLTVAYTAALEAAERLQSPEGLRAIGFEDLSKAGG